jgi:hypothetical protein
MPLIQTLKADSVAIQNWYADDAAAIGTLEHLRDWLQKLIHNGPKFGYFPEPQKSFLVVHPDFADKAKEMFEQSLGVTVVPGHRFLGGFVGDNTNAKSFVKKKVQDWSMSVQKLAKIAVSQPQAAFAALTKSLQFEWAFCQRVVPDCEALNEPLERVLREEFLPAVTAHEVSESDRILFSLPSRIGGLGIRDPISTADLAHSTSRSATHLISEAIQQRSRYNCLDHHRQVQQSRKEMKEIQKTADTATLTQLMETYSPSKKRALERISDERTSSWLSVLPVARDNFDLSAREFRDALALRYQRPLAKAPTHCDGCGQDFTISHALSCKKGGLIIMRHNEIRDAVGDISSLVWPSVQREPIVRDADDSKNISALVADLAVRGVWQPQDLALLDIRVTDTDASSYLARPVRKILSEAEESKKRKYGTACEERRAAFTPFVVSIDGAFGQEAKMFLRRLNEKLSLKWQRSYSEVSHWTRTRLSFAVLRATSHCLRGTRSKWRYLNVQDGSGLGLSLN